MATTAHDAAVVVHEAASLLPKQTATAIRAAISAAYYEGLRDGVRRYAWWKNGVQHVGSGAYTLEQAIARIDDAEQAGEWTP